MLTYLRPLFCTCMSTQASEFLRFELIDPKKSPNPKSTHANRETTFAPLKKDQHTIICFGEPLESTGPINLYLFILEPHLRLINQKGDIDFLAGGC